MGVEQSKSLLDFLPAGLQDFISKLRGEISVTTTKKPEARKPTYEESEKVFRAKAGSKIASRGNQMHVIVYRNNSFEVVISGESKSLERDGLVKLLLRGDSLKLPNGMQVTNSLAYDAANVKFFGKKDKLEDSES
jgi:hypothetical protein